MFCALSLDTAPTLREFKDPHFPCGHMATFSYDDPKSLFRQYQPWECEDGDYPFIWEKISDCRRAEKLYRCDDCGFAYLEEQERDILTVHHFNLNKADCRRENLVVYCWLCHSADHNPDVNMKAMRCKYCKGYFLGWSRLRRHIKGIHRPFELKIPELQLDRPPTSYVKRDRVWAAIQQKWL
jgi:hypothetical protein